MRVLSKPATAGLVDRILQRSDLDPETKSDVAASAALVFVSDPNYEPDWPLLNMAGDVFWDGIATDIGALPAENSLKYEIYFTRFHFRHADKGWATPAVGRASKALLRRLLAHDLHSKTAHELGQLLYSYCAYVPNGAKDCFSPYLSPDDSLSFVQEVLKAADAPERKQQLSTVFGSLLGDILYRDLGQDAGVRDRYAQLVTDWYTQYAAPGWGIPKFLREVADDYPTLKERIDRIFKTIG